VTPSSVIERCADGASLHRKVCEATRLLFLDVDQASRERRERGLIGVLRGLD
jgi:hypothetical protein